MPNVSLGFPVGFNNFSWAAFGAALPGLLILTLVLTTLLFVVKPILKLIFLPINFLTLGLFNFILYVALIWLAIWLVPQFEVTNLIFAGINFGTIGSIVAFALIFSLAQSTLLIFFK